MYKTIFITPLKLTRTSYVFVNSGDPGRAHGAAVRRFDRGSRLRGGVPPGTFARARRIRGRREQAVRRRAVRRRSRDTRVLLGPVRAAGRHPVPGRDPERGRRGSLDAPRRVLVGPLRAAHRQHAVRRHRVRAASVLPRAQRTDAGRLQRGGRQRIGSRSACPRRGRY